MNAKERNIDPWLASHSGQTKQQFTFHREAIEEKVSAMERAELTLSITQALMSEYMKNPIIERIKGIKLYFNLKRDIKKHSKAYAEAVA